MSRLAHQKSAASSADTVFALGKMASIDALNRLSFGADQESVRQLSAQGLEGWLEEQLNPMGVQDAACEQQIASFTMPIKYSEHKDGLWPAVDEINTVVIAIVITYSYVYSNSI
jgi:hypothetical protein